MDLRFKPYNLLQNHYTLHCAVQAAGARARPGAGLSVRGAGPAPAPGGPGLYHVSCICPECGEGDGEVQISLVSAMAPIAYTHHTTGMLRLLAPLLAQVPRDMV